MGVMGIHDFPINPHVEIASKVQYWPNMKKCHAFWGTTGLTGCQLFSIMHRTHIATPTPCCGFPCGDSRIPGRILGEMWLIRLPRGSRKYTRKPPFPHAVLGYPADETNKTKEPFTGVQRTISNSLVRRLTSWKNKPKPHS